MWMLIRCSEKRRGRHEGDDPFFLNRIVQGSKRYAFVVPRPVERGFQRKSGKGRMKDQKRISDQELPISEWRKEKSVVPFPHLEIVGSSIVNTLLVSRSGGSGGSKHSAIRARQIVH